MSTHNILVVEDDPVSRKLLRYIIEAEIFGATVYEIEDGVDVLDYLRLFDINLVTLDFTLKFKHGDELFREIREQHPNVKIVVISGNPEAIELEADALFTKPVVMPDVIDAIRLLLVEDLPL